jgi:Uma2 family endonuclease
MSTTVETPAQKRNWTDAEFMALAEDGQRYEIVNGELLTMGNSGALHGYLCSTILAVLWNYNLSHKQGAIFDSSTAFNLKNGNKRSPDISFFAKERLKDFTILPLDFLEGAPDLAVEVLSPNNTVSEIEGKITDYFANGTRLAWVVNPTQQYILVYRCPQAPDRLLKVGDFLDGEDVLAGFSFALADLFQPLSFE